MPSIIVRMDRYNLLEMPVIQKSLQDRPDILGIDARIMTPGMSKEWRKQKVGSQ
jgi:hypothetical protein